MSDLKERLRNAADKRDGFDAVYLAEPAAARIEELEAEVALMKTSVYHANDVADAAIENTRAVEAKLLEIAEAAFYEGFAEGCDGSWVEGDPSYAWKKSEVYTKVRKLK